jgi:phosphate transport system substrate-binding protein
MKPSLYAAAFTAHLLAIPAAFALDQNLPAYQPVAGISGQLKSVGSDTLDHEMQLWAKGFEKIYPDVKIEIEGKGSATAPAALLEGVSQFGPMSRFMTAEETDAFEKKFGYKVTAFPVAMDALAVYVNKDNPIKCLSMVEVDRIFSSTRKGSGGRSIDTWGDVGLTGEWATKPISIYGRNTISGTYEFFRQLVLYGGEYKPEVKQQVGSETVVQGVAGDKFAIGYSGIGYKTDGVRAVPLGIASSLNCHGTSEEETRSGKYPIARFLYIYLNKKPNEALDPLRGEFIKFILSKDGQSLTEQGGYYPITNEMREAELKKLGLSAPAR